MNKKNPYSLSFGTIPHQLIGRDIIISDLLEALNNEYSGEQAFKLTGVRGAGKTVTLTIIEKELKNDNSWITVDLKSSGNVTEELISNLYSQEGFLTKYIDANLNLSAFGVGLNLSAKSPTTSTDVALKQLLSEVNRKKKKVLVVIDELRNKLKKGKGGALKVSDDELLNIADDYRELLSKRATERFNLQYKSITPALNINHMDVHQEADVDAVIGQFTNSFMENAGSSLRSAN